MRFIFPILTVAALSACSVGEKVVEDTVRQQAKSVINGLVAEKMPGLNVAPVTDCIIDNASTSEIFTIGQAAITGVTPSTTTLVLDIAQRPNTVQCISGNGLAVLGL